METGHGGEGKGEGGTTIIVGGYRGRGVGTLENHNLDDRRRSRRCRKRVP